MNENFGGSFLKLFTVGDMYVGLDGETGELGIIGTGLGGFTVIRTSGTFVHYIISTAGTGSWTVYKNGVSQTLYGTQWTPNASIYNSATSFRFDGGSNGDPVFIDDLRIYNEVIDATERAFIYNAGAGTQSDSGGGPPSPVTSAFYKFHPFVEAAMEGIHNLGSNQLKVALTNTAPTAANSVLTDISEISYANCSTRNVTTTSSLQTSGTYKLICADLVLTASGAVGPFRYIVLFNDTAASKNLIAWYDYASSITMANGDTFTIDFDGVGGVLTVT